MRYIYVKHEYDRSLVLKCDRHYIPIAEEKLVGDRPNCFASYLGFPGGFLGTYPSPAGPIFFVNNQKYLFTDPSWHISVAKYGPENEVTFTGLIDGKLVFRYPAVELDPINPWSDEEHDDFFIWLMTHKDDPYTIRILTIDESVDASSDVG
jgi:hypothetical protein